MCNRPQRGYVSEIPDFAVESMKKPLWPGGIKAKSGKNLRFLKQLADAPFNLLYQYTRLN